MAPKRRLSFTDCGGVASPTRVGGSKRRHEQVYTLNDFMEKLDPSDLQLVQQICQKYQINVPHLSSRKRIYRLQFRNKLPETLFTERKLRAENNIKVEIVIVDASNEVIGSGPMAMAEVEIVVLDGDFDEDKNGEWTEKEFEEHLMVPRKDKGPLLAGNLLIKLCNGVGYISDAKFTDNSCWSRSKKFRLGVKVLGEIGMAGEVLEGISNAFRVKDRHGERNQKDRPLSMNDSVCCLKGIFKKGPFHKKLVENNINTVRDFLKHDPNTLRAMLGMGKGKWENTYGHAQESKISFDILPYAPPNLPAPDQIFFEVDESILPQISNALVPLSDGFQQLPFFPEYEHPISVISTSAQNLPAINLSIESNNSFKTNSMTRVRSWKGTEYFETSGKVLVEGNGRIDVPNKFYIDPLSFRDIWLKLLFFIVRLKFAARKSQKSRYSKTSSPTHNAHDMNLYKSERQLGENLSFPAYGNIMDMDHGFDGIDNGIEYFDDYIDLFK